MHGGTRVYGIIGWPVAHSRSPQMHNAAFRALGMDALYLPFAVPPERLREAVAGLRVLGVAGWNVTIPHKTAVMPLLDELSPEAVRAGAVNTVLQREGRLIGHNTDGVGLLTALQRDLACPVAGARIVVLGAGGAARGAVAAFAGAGAGQVTVVNRTPASAELLVRDLQVGLPPGWLQAATTDELPRLLPAVDLLVNATSVGLKGERHDDLALALLPEAAKVYDMVYGPVATPLVAEARRRGLAASNGLGMLVAQGEEAFRYWTGLLPPLGVMAAAAAAGVGAPNP